MPICTYQYYFGSGENAALGKCGPGGGLEILTENVGHGGVTGGFSRGSRVVLGWFSGGSRGVLGWFSGGSRGGTRAQNIFKAKKFSCQKRLQKNGYGNRSQFCMEASFRHAKMMFRLHETTVSTSTSKLSKITKWVSKAGLLGSFLL